MSTGAPPAEGAGGKFYDSLSTAWLFVGLAVILIVGGLALALYNPSAEDDFASQPSTRAASATFTPSPSFAAVTPSAAATPPPVDTAPSDLGTQSDDLYVSTVRLLGGPYPDSDADIAALGRQICDNLRAGRDPEEYVGSLILSGVTAENAGIFLGAAPPAYCTDQVGRVNEFLESE